MSVIVVTYNILYPNIIILYKLLYIINLSKELPSRNSTKKKEIERRNFWK